MYFNPEKKSLHSNHILLLFSSFLSISVPTLLFSFRILSFQYLRKYLIFYWVWVMKLKLSYYNMMWLDWYKKWCTQEFWVSMKRRERERESFSIYVVQQCLKDSHFSLPFITSLHLITHFLLTLGFQFSHSFHRKLFCTDINLIFLV